MAKNCGVTYYAGDPIPPCPDHETAFPFSNWWDLLPLGVPEFIIFSVFALIIAVPYIFSLYSLWRTCAIYLYYKLRRSKG